MGIHEFIGELVLGIVEFVAVGRESTRGQRKRKKKLRSGTQEYPLPQDVIRETFRRHLGGEGSFAEFRIEGEDEPWVQVAHDDGENAVNFYYAFDEKDVLASFRRHNIEIPSGSVTHVKEQQCATYTIPAPGETETNLMVHQLFSRLYQLGETYAIVGSVE